MESKIFLMSLALWFFMEGKQKLRTGDVKPAHPYSGAISMVLENGSLTLIGNKFRPDALLDKAAFDQFCRNSSNRCSQVIFRI